MSQANPKKAKPTGKLKARRQQKRQEAEARNARTLPERRRQYRLTHQPEEEA